MTQLAFADRVQEVATNVGASSAVLLGASSVDKKTFAAAGLNGKTVPYCIRHRTSGQWEVGYGVYTSSNTTLTRLVVLSNSSGTTSLIVFSAGSVDVWNDLPAEKIVALDTNGDATLPGSLTVTNTTTTGALTVTNATTFGGHAYTWPATQTAGYFLQTDGAGGLSWVVGTASVLAVARTIGITGDLTWTSQPFDGSANVTGVGTLATVNADTGSFGSSTAIPTVTVNAKGLVTAVTTNAVVAPAGTLTGTTLAATVVASSLTSVGTLASLTLGGALTFTTAVSQVVPGATSYAIRNHANTQDNWIILDAGSATLAGALAIGGALTGVTTLAVTGAVTLSTQLGATSGGTGQNAVAVGDVLYGSATNTWSRLGGNTTTARQFLSGTGTGTAANAPAWVALAAADIPSLDASKITTGTLPETLGGTGHSTYTVGGILYASATTSLNVLAGNSATAKQFLVQSGNGTTPSAPQWWSLTAADVGAGTFSGAFTFANGLTSNGSITVTEGTITASTPAFTSTATWNNVGVTFVHNFVNVTDTTSAAGSLLAQWQVGGVNKFTVDKAGNLTAAATGQFGALALPSGVSSLFTNTNIVSVSPDTNDAATRTGRVVVVGYGKSPGFSALMSSGVVNAPVATSSGSSVLNLQGGAYDGTAWALAASINLATAENWAVGAHGTKITFVTTPTGSTVAATVLTLGSDASATFTGAGTFSGTVTGSAASGQSFVADAGATGSPQYRMHQNGTFVAAIGYDNAASAVYLNRFGTAAHGLSVDAAHLVTAHDGLTVSGSTSLQAVTATSATVNGSGQTLSLVSTAGASQSAFVRFVGTTAASATSTFYAGVNPFATDGSFELKTAGGNGLLIGTTGAVTAITSGAAPVTVERNNAASLQLLLNLRRTGPGYVGGFMLDASDNLIISGATGVGNGIKIDHLTDLVTLSSGLTVSAGGITVNAGTSVFAGIQNNGGVFVNRVTNTAGYSNALGASNGDGILVSRLGSSNISGTYVAQILRDDVNGATFTLYAADGATTAFHVVAGAVSGVTALTLSGFGGGTGVVSVGAVDSGGTGFRLLRVPN